MIEYDKGVFMKLILIDGNSIFFRAYYATAYGGGALMQNKEGVYTNALFGFVNMMEKILEEDYTHILVAFDTSKPTFRHLKSEDYKKGRPPMPKEMAVQVPLIHQYLEHKQIEDISVDGYEADDIIGTVAKMAPANVKVDIYSSDKDLLQLISDNVTVKLIKRGITEIEAVTPASFYQSYQIDHHLMVDLKALMGDSSDNIKGVTGVGLKTAIKLIQQYGSLDNVLLNKEQITGKLGENLKNEAEIAREAYFLAKICDEVPLELTFKDLAKKTENSAALVGFYQEMDLHSFIKQMDLENKEIEYQKISDEETLKAVLKDKLAVHIEFFDSNYHLSEIVGFGISDGKNHYYLPRDFALNSAVFKAYLEGDLIKYTYDLKAFMVKMLQENIIIKGFQFDLLLAAYLYKPHIARQEFKVIAGDLEYYNLEYDDVIYGRGKKKTLPDEEIYALHIVKKAKAISVLKEGLIKELKLNEQLYLLNEIEIPLTLVLAEMEYHGISLDLELLKAQKTTLKAQLVTLEKEIHSLANKTFNVNSPKQLGEVLFVDLGLETGKKTKTKSYSTSVEVLSKLVNEHPIINKVLEYRQLNKLFSTYLEGLENSLFPDQKIHTIFNQTLTATGRLSSLEPNLQNIPIKTEQGREIRKLFVAEKGHLFIAADYSQIELRVLAHLSGAKNLLKDFNEGLDIHSETAKKVFNSDHVSNEERQRAKAVNFGIIYGMSAYGLSEDLNISRNEAETFIKKYFLVYPEVKEFLDEQIKWAQKEGYVETIFKRRRYIPELKSPVFTVREFGKRTSMNAPIQGSAADIIKIAMVKLALYLKTNNLKSKILLQVHDELILEVPNEEEEIILQALKEIMEKAVELKVKLTVNVSKGESWYQL
jgi:DNA polymerase-1